MLRPSEDGWNLQGHEEPDEMDADEEIEDLRGCIRGLEILVVGLTSLIAERGLFSLDEIIVDLAKAEHHMRSVNALSGEIVVVRRVKERLGAVLPDGPVKC